MRRNVSLTLTQLGGAAALLGALLLVSTPALAQDEVTLAMARERFKEGVAYFDKKDFAKARVAFLQAYALKKHPAVLLNLAQSELRSGHEADAAKHFAQYLREHKDASESERQGAETGLTAAKALVAEVALDVEPSGAEIYVDGDFEGPAPLPGSIYLTPGAHRVQARKDGKTANSDVTAAAGQASKLSLSLAAAAAPAAPDDTTTTTTTTAAPAPEEPPAPQESPTSRKRFDKWVVSTPGAIVGVGLTGVGLIGGGAFFFGSRSAYSAADSVADGITAQALIDGKMPPAGACNAPEKWLANTVKFSDNSAARAERSKQYSQNCDKYKSNVQAGDTFKTLAIVSFAVAGAAAVGTIVYYFVDSKETSPQARAKNPRRVVVLPVYQPGFAGGLISGAF